MSEAVLKDIIDKSVDKLIKSLDKQTFVSRMPKEIDRNFLSVLHDRLATILRPKLFALMEKKFEEDNVGEKLQKLDQIVASTPHSTKHVAWRPIAGPEGISVAGQDLKVYLTEKAELENVLRELNSEIEELEKTLAEEEDKVVKNSNEITNNVKLISDL